MATSGNAALVAYGYESTFKGGASLTRLFGHEQKINSLEYSNSQQALPQLYSPEVCEFVYNTIRGSATVEYVLGNPFIFTSVLHNPTTSVPSGGVYTHTWTSDPTVNTNIRTVKSLHIEFYVEGSTSNIDRNAKGVISPSINIKTGIDQPVTVSQTLNWGYEDTIDTSLNATPPTCGGGFTPYTFVNASIKLPVSGGTIASVQNIDFTIDTGAELTYNINSEQTGGGAVATGAWNKILNITGKLQALIINKDLIDKVVARTEVADMEIKFTNGLAGSSQKIITITLTGIGLSRHGTSGMAPGELLMEELDLQARRITIVATNSNDGT